MIVIPAAGNGQRFKDAGYTVPKHLVPLGGVPMVDRVIANVRQLVPNDEVHVLTQDMVGKTLGTCETITKGPAVKDCERLVIANCDQLLEFPADWQRGGGVVFTFPSASPAHSYVTTNSDGRITAITEKEVTSPDAVAGVYYFEQAGPIMDACQIVCEGDDDELYLSAALQVLLDHEFPLYAVQAKTAILGTPEDFQRFEVAMSLCAS